MAGRRPQGVRRAPRRWVSLIGVQLPGPLAGRTFTRREALEVGVTDGRLRRLCRANLVRHLAYGLWCDAARPAGETLHLEAVVRLEPRAVASHATAARLWGASPADGRLHVTIPAERVLRSAPAAAALRSGPGLVVHRDVLTAAETRVRRGVTVTDPYRTVLDVARRTRRSAIVGAVAVADQLLVAEHVEREHLAGRLARLPSGRGIAVAREVVALCRYGAQSPGETRLSLVLDAYGVPEPQLQYRIACRRGIVVADLCWPAARLVVEYDGFGPHTERHTFERDRRRWSWLREDGWELRAYTAESVRDRPAEVAAEVLGLMVRAA